MRVLLIEDDTDLVTLIGNALHREGLAVDAMMSATEGWAALEIVDYDVVVLDLGLPDGDGRTVLQKARAAGKAAPILILTARDEIADRVSCLNAGADDYLVKPFAMNELIARIKALLRRPGGVLGVNLTLGNVALDTVSRQVDVAGHRLALGQREVTLLEQLLRAAGRVVNKAVIENHLYGFGEEVSSNSVEVHVHRLRRKLSGAGASVELHTVRGIGYLLDELRDG